ncbi:MAG: Rrf2 family transcriptional regulator [Candidatus Omnitrophica bacterium]|nr:Rrf2 family transcriptional regulator [Candidatus Omnitrophota bacterium]
MILTTRSSYGVRALINVAILHQSGKPVSVRTVAREEGISEIYLEQIFNCLKKRGILKATRGPRGGYALASDPAEITVYDVVMALEESLAPGKCSGRSGECCEKASRCVSKEVWDAVENNVKKTLMGYTLKSLAERAVEVNPCREAKVKLFESR